MESRVARMLTSVFLGAHPIPHTNLLTCMLTLNADRRAQKPPPPGNCQHPPNPQPPPTPCRAPAALCWTPARLCPACASLISGGC
jgi:hypothetical protein